MKRILLFARDPGGANTIIPLADPLKKKGYRVLVFGKDVALSRFVANGVKAKDINKAIKKISLEEAINFLRAQKPDFILTGTSADDMTEKFLWKAAECLKIPSFAILDQWINYGIRFSRFGVNEIEQYKKEREHQYLPSKILVMDELAQTEAIKDGLPKSKIVITGQPYFEYLKNKKFSTDQLKKIKKIHSIKENETVVLFASEPLQKTYGRQAREYWGYDEIFIFRKLYDSLVNTSNKFLNKKIKLIVKLHPKEDSSYYSRLISELKNDNITVRIDQASDSLDMIKISDFVFGMSSMLLLESFLLNKPTVSMQINLKRGNPFILDRIGLIKTILTEKELDSMVTMLLKGEKGRSSNFDLVLDPINRVIEKMEQMLCQN